MGISELIRRSPEGQSHKSPGTPKSKRLTSGIEGVSPTNDATGGTVRRRRGYRPLSVLTPSMFFPFDGEISEALSLLEQQEVDGSLSTPSKSLNAQATRPRTPEYAIEPEPSAGNQTRPSPHPGIYSTLQHPQDLTSMSEVKCSYPTLMFLPPPDPSLHPAFQDDPFNSISDSPNLITTSTVSEIRKLSGASQASWSSSFETCTTPSFGGSLGPSNRTSESSDTNLDDGRRRIHIPDYIRSPDPILGKKGFSARMEGSPLAGRFREIVIPESVDSLPDVTEADKKRVGSGSLRKLSDMFKSKLSRERALSSSSGVLELTEDVTSPFLEPRSILEERLRITTYSPQYNYQANSAFPRHPITGRSWRSRNLKCTTCLDESCTLCGRACCAFKASVRALEIHKNDSDGRTEALQRIQEITMIFPYGKEAPTFLQCSVDAETGCGRLICPDCCGQCPDPSCKDIQCYKCKQDPWGLCEWHVELSPTVIERASTTSEDTDNSSLVTMTM